MPDSHSVVFTSGTTESINLIAYSWGLKNLKETDSVLITEMEHHSNIIPWQLITKKTNSSLNYIPLNNNGTLNTESINDEFLSSTKIISISHQSNVFGTINPIKEITKIAHAKGALVFVDAVHYAPHGLIDVQDLDCDFLVTSIYKYFGPHVSAVFGKKEHLENFSPYKVEPAVDKIPNKWETGTPDFSAISAIPSAIKYIISLSGNSSPTRKNLELAYKNITEYENELSRYFLQKVSALKHVERLYQQNVYEDARGPEPTDAEARQAEVVDDSSASDEQGAGLSGEQGKVLARRLVALKQ